MPPGQAQRGGVPVKIERLDAGQASELHALLDAYKAEIGEPPLDATQQKRLTDAIAAERIWFFAAQKYGQLIGMCSVSPLFSTFACTYGGIFEDFYIAPDHRSQGVARLLTQHAAAHCKEAGLTWLWVGAAQPLTPMYRALGFDLPLGNLLCMSL